MRHDSQPFQCSFNCGEPRLCNSTTTGSSSLGIARGRPGPRVFAGGNSTTVICITSSSLKDPLHTAAQIATGSHSYSATVVPFSEPLTGRSMSLPVALRAVRSVPASFLLYDSSSSLHSVAYGFLHGRYPESKIIYWRSPGVNSGYVTLTQVYV